MNKPLTMTIKETKEKLVDVCNKSGLSPIILDLIMQGIYYEINSLAQKQTIEEESTYTKMVEMTKDKNLDGDVNESEQEK